VFKKTFNEFDSKTQHDIGISNKRLDALEQSLKDLNAIVNNEIK
jgi:hypothetical protein